MKTLKRVAEAAEMRGRLLTLTPEDRGLWGAMSAGEMVCHVRGAFRMALGREKTLPVKGAMPPQILKLLALWMPMQWPHSLPTVAELERGRPAVEPGRFASDHAGLMAEFDDFVAGRENRTEHPMLGAMSPREWMRWGYLHTDHHLRQFGR